MHNIVIKEGAFIISDAHYSDIRPHFLEFIQDIDSKKLQPTQLIFMGDIFDALFGQVKYTQTVNKKIIDLINTLSIEIELIILEGNHDFNLKNIFLNAQVFKLSQQPLLCSFERKKIYLAHGDFNVGFGYKIYTLFIRNRVFLTILSLIDSLSSHFILKKLNKKLSQKEDCKELKSFPSFIKKRLENRYECDYFIEGHFHQNQQFKIDRFFYINLAAFACNQRYFSVKSLKDKELLEEHIFSKGI
ncbi:MAG: metallophosphoesterase [Campylobacterota bacterium]|nr:metallophosphoesterase [Campylobacterota bacterium]